MKRTAAIVIVILGVLAGWFALDSRPPETTLPADVPVVVEVDPPTRSTNMTDQIDALFPEAPAEVRAVAQMIMDGGVPTPDQIAAVHPDDLNRYWSEVPTRAGGFARGHTLLRQTVISRNVAAAEALLTAGADPFFNSNEMAFLALRMEDRPDRQRYWYPDYERGWAFLRLWLAHGGEPNAGYPGASSRLLHDVTVDNLGAVLILLEAGADPWERPPHGNLSDGTPYFAYSFHMNNANAASTSNEIAFRVALEGYYAGGTPEQIDDLMFLYERTAAQYVGSTGPENMRIIWYFQKVLPMVLEQTGRRPEGAIAEILAVDVPEDIGGFWLAPGEIRSPRDPSHIVNTLNQYGQQMWDE